MCRGTFFSELLKILIHLKTRLLIAVHIDQTECIMGGKKSLLRKDQMADFSSRGEHIRFLHVIGQNVKAFQVDNIGIGFLLDYWSSENTGSSKVSGYACHAMP